MKIDKKILVKIIVVAVIAAGAGFFGGMKYGQSAPAQTGAGQRAQSAGGFGANRTGVRGAGQNGNFAGGQIIAKDATSITVKLQDNSSKIVFVSSSTSVIKSAQGSLNDLTVGENATVTGTANSDGSITAQSVQVRPTLPQSQT